MIVLIGGEKGGTGKTLAVNLALRTILHGQDVSLTLIRKGQRVDGF